MGGPPSPKNINTWRVEEGASFPGQGQGYKRISLSGIADLLLHFLTHKPGTNIASLTPDEGSLPHPNPARLTEAHPAISQSSLEATS
jgi:hypothetical protein